MIVTFWNNAKSLWSRINDWVMRDAKRRQIPSFESPHGVSLYLSRYFVYRGDRFGGAGDNYTNPERLQYAMETGDWGGMPTDCDDLAIWAYRALLTIPECQPVIVTLRDAGVSGSHVICTYRWHSVCGVIDTNGNRTLPNLDAETLCSTFNEIYKTLGYRYVEAVTTDYPF